MEGKRVWGGKTHWQVNARKLRKNGRGLSMALNVAFKLPDHEGNQIWGRQLRGGNVERERSSESSVNYLPGEVSGEKEGGQEVLGKLKKEP